MKAGLRLSLLAVAIASLAAVNGIPVVLIASTHDTPQHDNTAALDKRVGLSDALLTDTARVIDGNHRAAERQDLFPTVPGDLRSTARLNLQPNEARASSSTSHGVVPQAHEGVSTTLTLLTQHPVDPPAAIALRTQQAASGRPSGQLRSLPTPPSLNVNANVGLTKARLEVLYSTDPKRFQLQARRLKGSIHVGRSQLDKAIRRGDKAKAADWKVKLDADIAFRAAVWRRLDKTPPEKAEKHAETVFNRLQAEPMPDHVSSTGKGGGAAARRPRTTRTDFLNSRFATPELQKKLKSDVVKTVNAAKAAIRRKERMEPFDAAELQN